MGDEVRNKNQIIVDSKFFPGRKVGWGLLWSDLSVPFGFYNISNVINMGVFLYRVRNNDPRSFDLRLRKSYGSHV